MGLSLIEVFRTDIATFQRHVGAWCGLVALMTVPFVLGLHWLIPERILLSTLPVKYRPRLHGSKRP